MAAYLRALKIILLILVVCTVLGILSLLLLMGDLTLGGEIVILLAVPFAVYNGILLLLTHALSKQPEPRKVYVVLITLFCVALLIALVNIDAFLTLAIGPIDMR